MKTILFVDHEEIGAFLFSVAKIINESNSDLKAYYVSFGHKNVIHDSVLYHYGKTKYSWDYTKPSSCFNPPVTVVTNGMTEHLKQIMKDVKPDSVFCTSMGGYICYLTGVKYNNLCYGADIEQVAFNLGDCTTPIWKQKYIYDYVHDLIGIPPGHPFLDAQSTIPQVIGIRNADILMITPRAFLYLKKLMKSYRLFQMPLMSVYGVSNKTPNASYKVGNKKIFFSSTRHLWGEKRKYTTENKGNDVPLRAIALYKEKTGDNNFKIHLIEKGPDTKDTKRLLAELGLVGHTKWLEQVIREQLFDYYKDATICFGQFAVHLIEMNAIEPMSCGIPTISWYGNTNKSPFIEVPWYSDKPPTLNSRNPDRIANYMMKLLGNQEEYNTASHKAYVWYRDNCSTEQLVKNITDLINSKNICTVER